MATLPHISIQQLSYLVAVSDEPTWAEAAEAQHVSASALSQGIAELERRLDMTLFDREGRRRIPRTEAAPVFDYARSVVVQTEELVRWSAHRSAGQSGPVRVGMIDVAAVHHFPSHLRNFTAQRTDVTLELSVAPSRELVDRTLKGTLDLAVVVQTETLPSDLSVTPLLTEPLAVYKPPGATHRGGPTEWGPWVGFPEASHTRSLIAEALTAAGADYTVIAESNQPDVLRQMVQLGMGWTVLPVSQGEGQAEPLLRARKRPLLHRSLVAIGRSDRLDHPAADALMAELHADLSARPPR